MATLHDRSINARASERAKRNRAYARDARLRAARYPAEMQAAFIKIAGYWEQLALEAEADADERTR